MAITATFIAHLEAAPRYHAMLATLKQTLNVGLALYKAGQVGYFAIVWHVWPSFDDGWSGWPRSLGQVRDRFCSKWAKSA